MIALVHGIGLYAVFLISLNATLYAFHQTGILEFIGNEWSIDLQPSHWKPATQKQWIRDEPIIFHSWSGRWRGTDVDTQLTLRPDGTDLAGHWEFPGGKVAAHETHGEALRREVFEELDCVVAVGELAHSVTHSYPGKTVQLFFYRCELAGEPKPMLGQGMRWVPKRELARLPFPEADRALIVQLVVEE